MEANSAVIVCLSLMTYDPFGVVGCIEFSDSSSGDHQKVDPLPFFGLGVNWMWC